MKFLTWIFAALLVVCASPAFANEEAVDMESYPTEEEYFDGAELSNEEFALRPPHRRHPHDRRPHPGRRGPHRPAPRGAIWECSANPIVFPWTVFRGMRAYSYWQAYDNALYACERNTNLQCVIRHCRYYY